MCAGNLMVTARLTLRHIADALRCELTRSGGGFASVATCSARTQRSLPPSLPPRITLSALSVVDGGRFSSGSPAEFCSNILGCLQSLFVVSIALQVGCQYFESVVWVFVDHAIRLTTDKFLRCAINKLHLSSLISASVGWRRTCATSGRLGHLPIARAQVQESGPLALASITGRPAQYGGAAWLGGWSANVTHCKVRTENGANGEPSSP